MRDMNDFEWGDGVDKFSIVRSKDIVYLHVSSPDGSPKVRFDLSIEYATKLRDDLVDVLMKDKQDEG